MWRGVANESQNIRSVTVFSMQNFVSPSTFITERSSSLLTSLITGSPKRNKNPCLVNVFELKKDDGLTANKFRINVILKFKLKH